MARESSEQIWSVIQRDLGVAGVRERERERERERARRETGKKERVSELGKKESCGEGTK